MNQRIKKPSQYVTGVSVIICCYNSALRLPETLQHLAAQQVSETLTWEIILIDNASTDNTAETAKHELEKYNHLQYRIAFQPISGKTAALEMGYAMAQYEYILICDDDNWLEENYVQQAYELMNADSTIGALGGKGIPVCEQTPPEWFDVFSYAYAVGPQPINQANPEEQFLYGAGMVMRKDALEKVKEMGLEYELSCRKGDGGNLIIGGGDVEVCYLFSLLNFRIVYNETLQFSHYISRNRLNADYLERLYKGYGFVMPLLSPYKILLKQSRQGKRANRYFWVSELGKALNNTVVASLVLCKRRFFKKSSIVQRMYFKESLYLAYYYARYNFYLTSKLLELENKFGGKE